MNARQRRKAYRAMPQAGANIECMNVFGRPVAWGTSVGPQSVDTLGLLDGAQRGNVPSVHRICMEFDSGKRAFPLVKHVHVIR